MGNEIRENEKIGRTGTVSLRIHADIYERLRRAKYRFEKDTFNDAIKALLDEHDAIEKDGKRRIAADV